MVLDFLFTLWDFLNSHYPKTITFSLLSFSLLGQKTTPGCWSALSHPRAWCEREEADLLNSKTQYFLLFVMPNLGYQWQLLSPSENISLMSGIWYSSSLNSENEMNVLGLWFHSWKSGTPLESENFLWFCHWFVSLSLFFLQIPQWLNECNNSINFLKYVSWGVNELMQSKALSKL